MVGANTFRNPGPHREARDDPRPPLGRAGRARHRRRVVRPRARRLRHRLRRGPGRAARPPRRVGDADAPPARWRAVQPRGPLLHVPRRARARRGPVQAHLPILVGGSGPKKTLRTVAQRADAWNTLGHRRGGAAAMLEILGEHCADVGRDIATIEMTISFPIILRDTARRGRGRRHGAPGWRKRDRRHRATAVLLGSPTEVADALRPYRELGFETVIVRMPAPYDRETIDRMAEVGELLDADAREGRRPRRRDRWREAGARVPAGAPRGRPDGRRQHRRRHRTARPPRDARPRRVLYMLAGPFRRRARLGRRRRDLDRHGRPGRVRRGGPGSASATATSRPTSRGPRGSREGRTLTDGGARRCSAPSASRRRSCR